MGQSISSFFSFAKGKPINIIMLGLDNAGKTTLLYQMKLGEIVNQIPTIGFNIETFRSENLAIASWDIYPHSIRTSWNKFIEQVQGVIFVIDLSDSKVLPEALEELKKLFDNDKLQDAVFLIFANKMDKAVIKIEELVERIGKVKQLCNIQITCATTGKGLKQGMSWLANALQK